MAAADDRPLAGQPWLRAPASREVLAALAAGGRPVRFVGGCVRDGLLGLPDSGGELDLATPEPPERVMRLLEAAGLPAIPTGLAHGTVTTRVGGRQFEITTLRRDIACDGRHAEVAFTDDFRVDAARRDFTINAMSCDLEGRLYDYFDGRADLAAGRVRFVGAAAERIVEDHLRILRFFRFFARYGRPPADPEALRACRAAAPDLQRLSGERLQTEMRKLLKARRSAPVAAADGRNRRARTGHPGAGREAAPGPAGRAGPRERSPGPACRAAPPAARRARSRRTGRAALASLQPRWREAARPDRGAAASPARAAAGAAA